MSQKSIKSSILVGKSIYLIGEDGYVLNQNGGPLFCGKCGKKYGLDPVEDEDKLKEIHAQLVENDEFSIICPNCGATSTDEFEKLRRFDFGI
jgi:uncharacterized Zn finger protein (UPF0148 family)